MRLPGDPGRDHHGDVSIHAPVKGATEALVKRAGRTKGFNPRTREGCDEALLAQARGVPVSIHAPVKGATLLLADAKG